MSFVLSPPYPPQYAPLGGQPDIGIDDPISAVFTVLFVAGFLTNGYLAYWGWRRRGRFGVSLVTAIFCGARIVALLLRIAWAAHRNDLKLAIAANVFTIAGVLLLYAINLVYARRLLQRHSGPLGQHAMTRAVFRFLSFSVPANLIMVITTTVYSMFTLDSHVRHMCRTVQLVGSAYITALSFVPVVVVGVTLLVRRQKPPPSSPAEARIFQARWQLLLSTALVLTLGAGFRCGVTFKGVPLGQSAWFLSRACYYCFSYAIEIVVVSAMLLARLDQRFRQEQEEYEAEGERRHLNTESEVFAGEKFSMGEPKKLDVEGQTADNKSSSSEAV